MKRARKKHPDKHDAHLERRPKENIFHSNIQFFWGIYCYIMLYILYCLLYSYILIVVVVAWGYGVDESEAPRS